MQFDTIYKISFAQYIVLSKALNIQVIPSFVRSADVHFHCDKFRENFLQLHPGHCKSNTNGTNTLWSAFKC